MGLPLPASSARRRRVAALTAGCVALPALVGAVLAPAATASSPDHRPHEAPGQPILSTRSAALLDVDGLRFRDLDGSGDLTPYEDWRRSADERAADLVSRMTLPEKAGTLLHGSLTNLNGAYNLDAFGTNLDRHITTYISRLSPDAATLADQHNTLQERAEAERLGIPLLISTDPRSGFSITEGQTVSNGDFTPFPDPIGMGAIGDPALTEQMADIIRREYLAVGIREGLSPQADIATEPRWTRINGTYGSVGETAKEQVAAYVAGLQDGTDGLGAESVATVVKHWVGYGAQENGYDSHYYYGRYATFPGDNLAEHIVPFEGAFESGASGVMPTYSILKDLEIDGREVEQVGAGHNEYLLQDLLRGQYGFDGVITSDWAITNDCPVACQANRPPNSFVGAWGVGTPWGVEELTIPERFASTINAGVDIVGGSSDAASILTAVDAGLIPADRIDEAAASVLGQKFELGLFENPYVWPAGADAVVGSAESRAVGLDAQHRSLTLLENEDATLPLDDASGSTVWLYGVDAQAAVEAGLTPVADVADADLAIVRLVDPLGGPDNNDLDFKGTEPGFVALAAAHAAGATTIAVPQLSRPLILGNVLENADAVVANYGVSDEALLDVLTGEAAPEGRLPFELPSSLAAVAAQYSDVPNDSAAPLFAYGAGLEYTDVDVAVTLTGERHRGSVVLTGTAVNSGNTPVALRLLTRFAPVDLGSVEAGETRTLRVDTRLRAVQGVQLRVEATAPDGTSETSDVTYSGSHG
jgi:beta-glucosidase